MRWNNTLWSLVLKCTVGSKGLGLLAVFNFIYKEKCRFLREQPFANFLAKIYFMDNYNIRLFRQMGTILVPNWRPDVDIILRQERKTNSTTELHFQM